MTLHFEELWEQCENFHKEARSFNNSQIALEELFLKINLYKAINNKNEIPLEERQKMKSRVLGEILLTITGLSLGDNINVYESLNDALQYRSTSHDASKLL